MYNKKEGQLGPFWRNVMESLRRYANHIDVIRRQKKMTVKDLCAGIVNERTYRRYLSLERKIPQEKVLEFCQRLEINPTDFYNTFIEKDKFEFAELYKLYRLLIGAKYEEFYKAFSNIPYKNLINKSNQKFYEYLNVKYLYDSKKISVYNAMDRYSNIINFPACKDNNIYDFSDILVLLSLSNVETKKEKSDFQATDILKRILLDDTVRYITADGKYILPSIYATVSMAFGRRGKLETCRKLSESGIAYSLKQGNNLALTNLYYAHSLSLYKLGYVQKAYDEAAKCIANTISTQNIDDYNHYRKILQSDFGVDPTTLFSELLNKYK